VAGIAGDDGIEIRQCSGWVLEFQPGAGSIIKCRGKFRLEADGFIEGADSESMFAGGALGSGEGEPEFGPCGSEACGGLEGVDGSSMLSECRLAESAAVVSFRESGIEREGLCEGADGICVFAAASLRSG
jgi:hypothetical protein